MASGIGDTSEANAIALLFNNTDWANLGDAAGLQNSAAAGSFFVGLSTGTLSDTSTQTTTQAAYGSYTRVGVARSAGGWTCSANAASNTAATTFPACTSGSETETDFSVGLITGTGAGDILFWGALNASLAVSSGITPSFPIGSLVCNLT